MSKFAKNHRPGQGTGYTPPMDSRVFNWLVIHSSAIIILASVLVYTIHRIG